MNNITELKFKDGDDGANYVVRASVTPCENGYVLDVESDESEWKEVYISKLELLERLGELL